MHGWKSFEFIDQPVRGCVALRAPASGILSSVRKCTTAPSVSGGMQPIEWQPGRVSGYRLRFNLEGRPKGKAAPANISPDPVANSGVYFTRSPWAIWCAWTRPRASPADVAGTFGLMPKTSMAKLAARQPMSREALMKPGIRPSVISPYCAKARGRMDSLRPTFSFWTRSNMPREHCMATA